jgi:hypothetical protein
MIDKKIFILILVIIILIVFIFIKKYFGHNNSSLTPPGAKAGDGLTVSSPQTIHKSVYLLVYNDPNKTIDGYLRRVLNYVFNNEKYRRLFENNIFNNVQFVYVNDENIRNTVLNFYNNGIKYLGGIGGAQENYLVLDIFRKYPDLRLFNWYSSAIIPNKPANIYRFLINDEKMMTHAINKIRNATCFYDVNHPWAQSIAFLVSRYGLPTIGYDKGYIEKYSLPEEQPICIAAVSETEKMLELIPESCPKLYGFDGSIFFKFNNDEISKKAQRMNFECIQGEPSFIPNIIRDMERDSGMSIGSSFPLMLDCIYYIKLLYAGLSDFEIQNIYTSYTGPLTFTKGEINNGNFSWYQYSEGNKWIMTERIINTVDGSCNIHPHNSSN